MKFIINPVSGGGRARGIWPHVERLLTSKAIEFTFDFTASSRQATDITREALLNGEDVIVAVGGDGTVNEVINGFFQGERKINPAVRLGIIPAGTGSDWCRTVGIPADRMAAMDVLLAGRFSLFDLGRISCSPLNEHSGPVTRYFLNAADAGFGAAVVESIKGTSKFLGHRSSYLWGLLNSLLRNSNVPIEVRLDGREIAAGKHFVVVVANGRFFGGGMHIAPQADARDGLIDVVLIGDIKKLEVVRNLSRLYSGRVAEINKVNTARGRLLEIESKSSVGVEVDGEFVGRLPARFEILPEQIKLIH